MIIKCHFFQYINCNNHTLGGTSKGTESISKDQSKKEKIWLAGWPEKRLEQGLETKLEIQGKTKARLTFG